VSIGRRGRRSLISIILCLILVVIAVPLAASPEQSLRPTQWPSSADLSPSIEGWPNALRIAGSNRYGTNLASSLMMRGSGAFPFGSANPSADWWGLGLCPRAAIIVAGDSAADALSASSLSDPTGLSRKPYLQRVAAGDPLFDPIGGFKRVDTDYAPIIITEAARNSDKQLTLSSRYALQDLRSGGCKTAREAIIVGGVNAVSKNVEDELVSMGYDSVYRVAGENRFATASAVARAIGTSPTQSESDQCADAMLDDGLAQISFYSNSVVEYRESVNQCELLSRTLVIADGVTGADAVAAGWWTSFWQVPLLLHDGSNKLPAATASVLQTLQISNLIILGGTSRISENVAAEAASLSGARVLRIGGNDRYETSVLMAKHFGGWWPSSPAASAEGAMLCIASSSGSGASARGWPDALGAGPWCAAAAGKGSPDRLLLPYEGDEPQLTSSLKASGRSAVPIILVPHNSSVLPDSVASFFRESFVPDYRWCSSNVFSYSCFRPGFAVVFGGGSSVSDEHVDIISSTLGGLPTTAGSASAPNLNEIIVTDLNLNPIYGDAGVGNTKVCFPRDSYESTRWLVAGTSSNIEPIISFDVVLARWYRDDTEGPPLSPGAGRPGCLKLSPRENETIWVHGVGLDGRVSVKTTKERPPISKFSISDELHIAGPIQLAGEPTYLDAKTGITKATFSDSESVDALVTMQGETAIIRQHSITIYISRGVGLNTNIDLFEGSWRMETVHGTVMGQVSGEARLSNGRWYLAGKSDVTGGSWSKLRGSGGFSGSIDVNTTADNDDVLRWRVDGLLSLPIDQ
jgi:putative cell wall-binding protein